VCRSIRSTGAGAIGAGAVFDVESGRSVELAIGQALIEQIWTFGAENDLLTFTLQPRRRPGKKGGEEGDNGRRGMGSGDMGIETGGGVGKEEEVEDVEEETVSGGMTTPSFSCTPAKTPVLASAGSDRSITMNDITSIPSLASLASLASLTSLKSMEHSESSDSNQSLHGVLHGVDDTTNTMMVRGGGGGGAGGGSGGGGSGGGDIGMAAGTAVMACNVAGDTTRLADSDALVNSIFNTREGFLHLCKAHHYQFDQLRRAKHST
jgi:hypothetical protein